MDTQSRALRVLTFAGMTVTLVGVALIMGIRDLVDAVRGGETWPR